MRKRILATLLIVALGASAGTLLVERLFFHPAAAKAQTVSGLEAYQFIAQHRKDDQVDESFFSMTRRPATFGSTRRINRKSTTACSRLVKSSRN